MLSKALSKASHQIRSFSCTVEIAALNNGARVVSESTSGNTSTLALTLDVGSRNDSNNTSGLANFVGTLAGRGAQTKINALGGLFDLNVTREKTILTAQVSKDNTNKALEILADSIVNLKIDDAVISSTKKALTSQAATSSRDFRANIFDHLHESAFLDNPLGRTVIGTEETIESISKGDIQSFLTSHYGADRVVVSAVGAVNQSQLSDLSSKLFSKFDVVGPANQQGAVFTGSDKRIRFDSMDRAHVLLAFRGPSATCKFLYPTLLLTHILGSWSKNDLRGNNVATRFGQEVSEGKVDSFSAFTINYKDIGLLGLHFVAPDNKLEDSMWYATKNLVRLSHNISEEELNRAKASLKFQVLSHSPRDAAHLLGHQVTTSGRALSASEVLARIDAITVPDLNDAAGKFINDEDHALAAVGPIYELPDYNWIRRRSYYHRY